MKKLRICSAIANVNWEHDNLLKGLKDAGHEVSNYDWILNGFNQYSPDWESKGKAAMNETLASFVESLTRVSGKFDVFFGYVSEPVILPDTLCRIKKCCDVMINYSCNNIASFGRTHSGIQEYFDYNFHAEKEAGRKFDTNKTVPVYFPFGVNRDSAAWFSEVIAKASHPWDLIGASFVGQLYGYRLEWITSLTRFGMPINIASKVSYDRMKAINLSSKISLGFRGLGNSAFEDFNMKQIRLRDFETLALGGFYLTEYHPELEEHYEIGKHIETFSSYQEFRDKALFFSSANQDRKRNIMLVEGHKLVVNEYTWVKRFDKAFKEIGLI